LCLRPPTDSFHVTSPIRFRVICGEVVQSHAAHSSEALSGQARQDAASSGDGRSGLSCDAATLTGRTRARELPALVSRLHRFVGSGDLEADTKSLRNAAADCAPWLGSGEVALVADQVQARVTGLGEVAALLADDSVTDLFVDGPGPVVVERNGRLVVTDLYLDDDGVQVLVERLMTMGRRRVDRHHPCVDLRLEGGMRANIVVAPAVIGGPCVSIRRFRSVVTSLSDMAEPEIADLMAQAVRNRANILVSGPTGSGKTTLLGLLMSAVDVGHRVVTIEDVAELKAQGPRLVRLEAQPADGEGRSEVTVRMLFRNALRMRPDRVVIGEIRGQEASDLIQALGTGHRGSMASVHADDPASALRRIELLAIGTGSTNPDLIRTQIASVIDVVLHVEREAGGDRQVVAVGELSGRGLTSLYGDVGSW